MKDRNRSSIAVLVLLLAVALCFGGIRIGMKGFTKFEESLRMFCSVEDVSAAFREATLSSVISGTFLTLGIVLVLTCFWYKYGAAASEQKEEAHRRKKHQAMEELNRQTQKLAHHQRLEIIGTLTSSISHEFNNLLTPIMGNSLLALEQLPTDQGELYDALLEIYSASRKAKEIISRLSDLSRKNSETSFRQVAPDDVIRKMVRTAEPARAKNVQINMNLNCWDQRLTANEIQLSQMVLNLILNGFHAMEPRGGILTLTTNFDETHIHIQVTDTGCGIPKDIQPQIFEPFFTTKEMGKGTGLGLAIVAQVVEDHHGEIHVKSKEGSGTTFTIRLPRQNLKS